MSDSIITQVQIGNTIYTCNTPAIYGIEYNRKKAWTIMKQYHSLSLKKDDKDIAKSAKKVDDGKTE